MIATVERQMKTQKCTFPTSSTASVHGIRGRCGMQAAREGEEPVAAKADAHEICGRTFAPGRAREECSGGNSVGAEGAAPTVARETVSGGEAGPAKRRRAEQACGLHGPGRSVNGETGTPSCPSEHSLWSSRRALLASLRAGVRPPERLT